MILKELIAVLDVDTQINVSESYKEIFDGRYAEYGGLTEAQLNKPVKVVWMSKVYNRIMIEI